jgi:hypothetical protein
MPSGFSSIKMTDVRSHYGCGAAGDFHPSSIILLIGQLFRGIGVKKAGY